jgi:hypothetical protein
VEIPRLVGTANGDLHPGDPGDRREVGLGIEGHVLVHVALHDEDAARPEEERMVVLGRHDGAERQLAVAARLAVDDDGLAPFLLQLVGDQPRAGVRARARTEREHEAHRTRGPLLGEARGRGERVKRQRERGDEREAKPTVEHDSPTPP